MYPVLASSCLPQRWHRHLKIQLIWKKKTKFETNIRQKIFYLHLGLHQTQSNFVILIYGEKQGALGSLLMSHVINQVFGGMFF